MKKYIFIQCILRILLVSFFITACDNNADITSSPFKNAQEPKETNKDIRANTENAFIDSYINGKINIHIYYNWIDATIDHYTNLEIVCFNTKKIQDTYASLLGIDF